MTDIQPILVGRDYRIRPLREEDRDRLYLAARDPLIWEQHPSKSRHQRNVFDEHFTALVAAGGTMAFEVRSSGRLVGCSRFYKSPNAPDEWSIGFTFIERSLWGGAANFALKTLMLDHLFESEDRVWFHIDRENIRSQKGTMKLGAIPAGECRANLLETGQMQHYLGFVLSRERWARMKSSRNAP